MYPTFAPSLRRSRSSLTATSLLLGAAFAAQATPLEVSLDELRRIAASTAPLVDARNAEVAAARADADRADALPDPALSIALDNFTVTGPDAFALSGDRMTMRRIGLMQDWPSREKRDARRKRAEAAVERAIDETLVTRLTVERLAGEAWIEAWAADAELGFLQALITESNRAVEIATVQLANASGSSAAALAAQVARAELELELRRAHSRRRAAQSGLARWLDTDQPLTLARLPDLTQLRVSADALRANLDRHAVLQLWQGRERAAVAAIDLARAGKRPDLGFALSYGARSAGLADMMMFEVKVGLPLFWQSRQDRDIAARLAEQAAVEAERAEARREQSETLERLLASWEGLRDESVLFRDSLLPLARDRSATALAGFSAGAGIEPWLDARRDEISSGRRAVQLRADLARAWLALDTLLPPGALPETQP